MGGRLEELLGETFETSEVFAPGFKQANEGKCSTMQFLHPLVFLSAYIRNYLYTRKRSTYFLVQQLSTQPYETILDNQAH